MTSSRAGWVWLGLAGGCSRDPLERVHDFGENPGHLKMYEHVPETVGPLPLLLVLHGCTQSHAFATDSGFTDLADTRGFVVIAAEQRRWNNGQRCFNWFNEKDTLPGSGEAASLAEMVTFAKSAHNIDDSRVFVAGVSAGGFMTSVMLATAPEVFAAGAVVAGGPYGCADGVFDSLGCANADVERDWAEEVLSVADGPWPNVLVMHGDADLVVAPENADLLVTQWTGVHGISDIPTASETASTAKGDVVIDTFGAGEVVSARFGGIGHTWAVDPDADCGHKTLFLHDLDFCGAAFVADFFGI